MPEFRCGTPAMQEPVNNSVFETYDAPRRPYASKPETNR